MMPIRHADAGTRLDTMMRLKCMTQKWRTRRLSSFAPRKNVLSRSERRQCLCHWASRDYSWATHQGRGVPRCNRSVSEGEL